MKNIYNNKTKLVTVSLILDFGIYGFTRFTSINHYYDKIITVKNVQNKYRNNYIKQR